MKSTCSYLFHLGSGPIFCSYKRNKKVSLLITIIEYWGLIKSCIYALWIHNLMNELNIDGLMDWSKCNLWKEAHIFLMFFYCMLSCAHLLLIVITMYLNIISFWNVCFFRFENPQVLQGSIKNVIVVLFHIGGEVKKTHMH